VADIVSERYALSLYEIAAADKLEKDYLDEFLAVCGIFKSNPDFLKVLQTPSITPQDKRDVLKNVFEGRIQPFLLNFLMLITDKGRVGLVQDMCQAYKERFYFENGIIEVRAITAKQMSDALSQKLKNKMETVTGKKVVLETYTDPSVIGGIVVKLGNEQFDTSLRTRLDEIAARLTNTIA